MDIPVIAVALVASLLLSRRHALIVVPIAWAIALVMVGWGPAHNADVHTDSAGFWVPWLLVLALCCVVVVGVTALRARRDRQIGA